MISFSSAYSTISSSGTASKMYVPVNKSSLIYSHFDHVSGVAAKKGQQGVSISKINILNTLIDNLSSIKSGKRPTVSATTDEQLDTLIENYQTQIKQAVEAMYNVTVTSVNTIVVAPRLKSRYTKSGVINGKVSAYKKAIVTLKEGEQIDKLLYGEKSTLCLGYSGLDEVAELIIKEDSSEKRNCLRFPFQSCKGARLSLHCAVPCLVSYQFPSVHRSSFPITSCMSCRHHRRIGKAD